MAKGNIPARSRPAGSPTESPKTGDPGARAGQIRQSRASGSEGAGSHTEPARLLFRGELLVPALVVFFASMPIFARLIGGAVGDTSFSDYDPHFMLAFALARQH